MQTYFLHQWSLTPAELEQRCGEIAASASRDRPVRLVFCAAEEFEWEDLDLKVPRSSWIDLHLILGFVSNQLPKSTPSRFTVHTWPQSWLYFTAADLDLQHRDRTQNVDRLFMCLNNRCHQHRCSIIDQLSRHGVLDLAYYTWHRTDPDLRGQYQFDHWQEHQQRLPSEADLDTTPQAQGRAVPREYDRVVFHLVTETIVDSELIDISEKTWRCILSAQPFIVLGSRHLHSALADWGFLLYDELFDHAFDQFPHWLQRQADIVRQIELLARKHRAGSWGYLRQRLEHKARANQRRACEIIMGQQHIPELVREFDRYRSVIARACDTADLLICGS